jgi:hypothetical protein
MVVLLATGDSPAASIGKIPDRPRSDNTDLEGLLPGIN